MKLDNRGWGYRDMIIYSSIIIICLVIVVFFSHIMYTNLEKDVSNASSYSSNTNEEKKPISLTKEQEEYYHNKELEVKQATYVYLDKNNYQGTSAIRKVDLDILEGFGYVNKVTDVLDGSSCKGYAIVSVKNSLYTVNPYIQCSHYVTNGYGD